MERKNTPDLVIFLNPAENAYGVKECTARNIPTVGIVDTHLDPRVVTYPIPANGDVSGFSSLPVCVSIWVEADRPPTELADGRINSRDAVNSGRGGP